VGTSEDHILLQKDLDTLVQWSETWQMEFNVKKCATMQFMSSKKKTPFYYTMKGEPLEIVHHHPYLGVELNDSLKYHLHIDNICKKVSSVLSFLKRNLKHCPPKVKERAYQSLIRPKCRGWHIAYWYSYKLVDYLVHECDICHGSSLF
jgi:hypothetical protein